MSWIENVNNWRQLPPEEKLLRRWKAIPLDVAQSMAFEKEPVEIGRLQEILSQIGLPDSLRPRLEPSRISSWRRSWRKGSCGRRRGFTTETFKTAAWMSASLRSFTGAFARTLTAVGGSVLRPALCAPKLLGE